MWRLFSFAILAHLSFGLEITWELEDYNEWNLPFAKTVDIKSKKDAVASRKHSVPP